MNLQDAIAVIENLQMKDDHRYKSRAKDWRQHLLNSVVFIAWSIGLTAGLVNEFTWNNMFVNIAAQACAWGLAFRYVFINVLLSLGGAIVIWQALKNKKAIPGVWSSLTLQSFMFELAVISVVLVNGFWLTALLMFLSKIIMSMMIVIYTSISRAKNI